MCPSYLALKPASPVIVPEPLRGILGIQFTSREHSNSRGSSRPGDLYPNMRQRIESNFCYCVPQDPNHDELVREKVQEKGSFSFL